VRCQTLIPSETGSQAYQDVTCIWSIQVRQGGTDLPGWPVVRPAPNCSPLSPGHPIAANASFNCQGATEFRSEGILYKEEAVVIESLDACRGRVGP